MKLQLKLWGMRTLSISAICHRTYPDRLETRAKSIGWRRKLLKRFGRRRNKFA